MNEDFTIVTIDGGAATGKSTTARGIAGRLNFLHVDTGSHYRAVTLAMIEAGFPTQPTEDAGLDLSQIELDSVLEGNEARVRAGGRVLESHELRSEQINRSVSYYAARPVVRAFLKDFQRGHAAIAQAAGLPGLVMEGRDIGSVIFPDAPFRFYLHADQAMRSDRRSQQGESDAIGERDRIDRSRKAAPLQCFEGAIRIDTGHYGIEAVLDFATSIIRGERPAEDLE